MGASDAERPARWPMDDEGAYSAEWWRDARPPWLVVWRLARPADIIVLVGPLVRLVLLVVVAAGCGARSSLDLGDATAPSRDASPPAPADGGSRDAGRREDASASCTPRRVRIAFTPTARAQLAVAIEGEGVFRTIALTEAVALRGIGNRPGALQMNSGFRWPYGRREGALPYWAHRRIEHGGAAFPRVIFVDRPEGHASGPPPRTLDPYFCQSFEVERSRREHLDAVTCASQLYSDKGRFITEVDVEAGYSEPFETADGEASRRLLGLTSAYPPRRDVELLPGDHPDVARFAAEALAAMPELDAVTMATPRGDAPVELVVELDAGLPEGSYAVIVEANTEGDYGGGFDPSAYPTPTKPLTEWDWWAIEYGYPYRGQGSVVFRVPIELRPGRAAIYRASVPAGRMDLHGLEPAMAPMDGMIDDPVGAPGSGADRLRMDAGGARVTVSTECP